MTHVDDPCLGAEERQELDTAWRALQAELQLMSKLVEQSELIDCNELHRTFLQLGDAFEALERVVMRAQQIRLLHGTQHIQARE